MKEQMCFGKADILLPDFIGDAEACRKWAVIACDQFTGEPEYWHEVEHFVGDAPSTLHMILPEAYLGGDNAAELAEIAATMKRYRDTLLHTYRDALVFVRRTQSDGRVRCGIVGAVDLECYDYAAGSTSPIRATEGTVFERLPPRVAVRRNAVLEAPHVMLLIDDPKDTVIGALEAERESLPKLYDFDLMQHGGHLEGYLLDGSAADAALARMRERFAKNGADLELAVGDGNHSLASAKARYEEVKAKIGEAAALRHPLRYALCEVVNLHDEALEFEPIYRLVKTDTPDELLDGLRALGERCEPGTESVECVGARQCRRILLGAGTHALTVGTLQLYLDAYVASHPGSSVDYIHGRDALMRLAAAPGHVGFLFDGMRKEELFPAVERSGALPRKTFSMGHAEDKRYYMECREIAK